MTEFKALSQLVADAEMRATLASDPAAVTVDPKGMHEACESFLREVLMSQERMDRMVAKAAVKDPDMRIYSDAMVEKIKALAVRHTAVIESLTLAAERTLPAAQQALGMEDTQKQIAFFAVETQSREGVEGLEGSARAGVFARGEHMAAESARLEKLRLHLEAEAAAEGIEMARREVEASTIAAFRQQCGGRAVEQVAGILREAWGTLAYPSLVEALVIVLDCIVRHPEAEGTRRLRCSNPRYASDFTPRSEMALVAIGYFPAYFDLGPGRHMVLEEPSAEEDVERWIDWTEERRGMLSGLRELQRRPPKSVEDMVARFCGKS